MRRQLTFFSFAVRRVICCLEMVTLSGHYPTRCTWRRKPYAHDINCWVIPGPGAVSGCFPGISIPQFSSYFGIKTERARNLCHVCFMSRPLCAEDMKSVTIHAYTVCRVQTLEHIILPSGYRFPGSETYWHHSRLQPESKVVCMH